MRVLMLSQFYPPILGGEERFVRDFSAALAARGHEVSVATFAQPGYPAFAYDGAVGVHRIPSSTARAAWLYSAASHTHAPPFPDPEATWALRRIIARERPAIVHAHNWLVHSFLPLKAWSGARLVLTLHDYSLACAKKKLLYRGAHCSGPAPRKCLGCAAEHYGPAKGIPTAIANRALGALERRAVDLFLPESQAVAVGNGLVGGKEPYEVIPVFVPDALGVPSASGSGMEAGVAEYVAQLPSDDFLLFVGAFGSYKGVDVLLRAYGALRDESRNVPSDGPRAVPPLVIIGYETTEYPVATTALPPGVTVLKNWPHAAVMAAWRRSVIGLVPSVWAEPFGLVALEAMASGRPVIASRIGGLTDIVLDGETGLLVPPGDAAALRAALARLLADPALRERLGQAGRSRVAEFQAAAVLPRIERAYRALLANRPLGAAASARTDGRPAALATARAAREKD